jgi:hypothetical protein
MNTIRTVDVNPTTLLWENKIFIYFNNLLRKEREIMLANKIPREGKGGEGGGGGGGEGVYFPLIIFPVMHDTRLPVTR